MNEERQWCEWNTEPTRELARMIKANPGMPVIPMVDSDVIGDNEDCQCPGWIGNSQIRKFVDGETNIWFLDDDPDEVVRDCTNTDPDDMTDDELEERFRELPWRKAIFVTIKSYF